MLITSFVLLSAASAGLYLMGSPLFGRGVYYNMLFYPSKYPAGYFDENVVDGVKAQDIYFQTESRNTLHGWYFHNPASKTLVIMHHGNGGNISILQWYTSVLLSSGASVFLYDYAGYGRSTGKPSLDECNKDADAALKCMQDRGWDTSNIINLGLSLGSGVASELSQKHQFAGLILLAPYTNIRRAASDVIQFLRIYPDSLWPEHDLGSKLFCKNPNTPVLILHGKSDGLIPFQNALELEKLSNGKVQLVPLNCGHADFHVEDQNFRKYTSEFISHCQSTMAQKSSK